MILYCIAMLCTSSTHTHIPRIYQNFKFQHQYDVCLLPLSLLYIISPPFSLFLHSAVHIFCYLYLPTVHCQLLLDVQYNVQQTKISMVTPIYEIIKGTFSKCDFSNIVTTLLDISLLLPIWFSPNFCTLMRGFLSIFLPI